MILNPVGSLLTHLDSYYDKSFKGLPLARLKYIRWDRAYNEVPSAVKPLLQKMFDLMPEDKEMQWVVDYKVRDLRVGDCGVALEGWHLDCVANPYHNSKPETHLLYSTDFGTEYVTEEIIVLPNETHFKQVLDRCGDLQHTQVLPNTITQYGRFNLHRAPIVTKDCRRMTLRLTQTEVIKRN